MIFINTNADLEIIFEKLFNDKMSARDVVFGMATELNKVMNGNVDKQKIETLLQNFCECANNGDFKF